MNTEHHFDGTLPGLERARNAEHGALMDAEYAEREITHLATLLRGGLQEMSRVLKSVPDTETDLRVLGESLSKVRQIVEATDRIQLQINELLDHTPGTPDSSEETRH